MTAGYLVSFQPETSLDLRFFNELEVKKRCCTMSIVHPENLSSRQKQPRLITCDLNGLQCAEQAAETNACLPSAQYETIKEKSASSSQIRQTHRCYGAAYTVVRLVVSGH